MGMCNFVVFHSDSVRKNVQNFIILRNLPPTFPWLILNCR